MLAEYNFWLDILISLHSKYYCATLKHVLDALKKIAEVFKAVA